MDGVASIVGIASFAFQTFQGCVQAFQLIEAAQHIGQDGDFFRAGLLWEKYRLVQWGQRAGLLEQGRANSALNWDIARVFLEQIEGLLTSADHLKKRYALEVSEEEIQAEQLREVEAPKKGIAGFMAKLKPDIYTTAGKVIQSRNGPAKRVRWAAVGKTQAARIIADIARLNDNLGILLDSTDRESRRIEDEGLLRGLLSLSTTTVEVSQIEAVLPNFAEKGATGAIAAAAHMKQVRLMVGTDKRDDEVKTTPSEETRAAARMPVVKTMTRTLWPYHGQDVTYNGLEFAVHGGVPVVIQWKVSEEFEQEKHNPQMKLLVALLCSMEDPSFRSLPCLGHYPVPHKNRHGIVYATPDRSVAWEMKSLRDLMAEVPNVSLERRFKISKDIAETILQLHTAGWLHKNLKSQNIMFISEKGSSAAKALLSEPLIFGYDYARPDSTAGAAYTQLSHSDLASDLYRHPKAQGNDRETYQKRFDMYALGCVLVELLFWKPLAVIHTEWTDQELPVKLENAVKTGTMPDDWKLPEMTDLLENELAVAWMYHLGGGRFVNAIRACLFIDKKEGDQEAFLKDQIRVVEILGSCHV